MENFKVWMDKMFIDMDNISSDEKPVATSNALLDSKGDDNADFKLQALHAALNSDTPNAADLYSLAKFYPEKRKLEIDSLKKKINFFDNEKKIKNPNYITLHKKLQQDQIMKDEYSLDSRLDVILEKKLNIYDKPDKPDVPLSDKAKKELEIQEAQNKARIDIYENRKKSLAETIRAYDEAKKAKDSEYVTLEEANLADENVDNKEEFAKYVMLAHVDKEYTLDFVDGGVLNLPQHFDTSGIEIVREDQQEAKYITS